MLFACSLTTDAGWFRRRRSRSSSTTRNHQIRADVRNNNGVITGTGTYTYKKNNWETSIHGSINNNGGYNYGASLTYRFKRSDDVVRGVLSYYILLLFSNAYL